MNSTLDDRTPIDLPTGHPERSGIRHRRARPFLLFDAVLTGGNGLAYLLGAGWLAAWFGAPEALLLELGALLVVIGIGVAVLATRRPIPRLGVALLAGLNTGWVLASLGYAVLGDLTALGTGWCVLQALLVAVFAAAQAWFARKG